MRRLLSAALCTAAVACSKGPGVAARPPRAEFLVASLDSTFWVTSDTAVHVRGVPIMLARYDGHFYELYTVDDDRSYDEALLVGERLYSRDIASGDSTVVFADTTIARIADEYAREHPDERPLQPDEEGDPDPETSATSQIDVLDVLGPYVSFEYHVDVATPGNTPWHATRRGVLDLRTGSPTSVAELFGASVARTLADSGRRGYEAARDSILAEQVASPAEARAAEALRRSHFDERSFSLSAVDGKPAVMFDIPGRGEGPAGNSFELDPITVAPTSWWSSFAPPAPATNDAGDDVWTHLDYRVIARYDTVDETVRLSLADSARREWPIATILGPVREISWLDDPPLSAADRMHLFRAFTAAASYDHPSTVAVRKTTSITRPVAYAPRQDRPRKSARDLRAHDARERQQHGPRVWRRGAVDDGQDRGHRGVSPQSVERRHGVDRPRRFSAADSPGRPARHEGERQLRRSHVDGSRSAR
jgi:hypothetical protein